MPSKRFTEDFLTKWSKTSGSDDQNEAKSELTRLRLALQKDPSNPMLWFEYGQVHLSMGNPDEAWASFSKAETLGAKWPALYLALGLSQVMRDRPKDAANMLFRALTESCEEQKHPYLDELTNPTSLEDVRQDLFKEGFSRPEDQLKLKAVSLLMNVPGIGRLKANALYDSGFRNVEDLKEASVDELAEIKGIGLKSAQKIKIVLTFQDRLEHKTNQRLGISEHEHDDETKCPLCGTILGVDEGVCYECGMVLKEEEAVQAELDLMEQMGRYEEKLRADQIGRAHV